MKALPIVASAVVALAVVAVLAYSNRTQSGSDSAESATGANRVDVKVRSVPLDARDPTRTRVGRFVYVGGLELEGLNTDRLHGLSDLEVRSDGRLLAVSDLGSLMEARLDLDASQRLHGLSDVRLSPLADTNGRAMVDKQRADAEGLAVLPNDDRLVSFERDHRIWMYSSKGGPPLREVPKPDVRLPSNEGLEALAVYPSAGQDAYVVGAENDGRLWLCHLASQCESMPARALPGPGFGLAGLASYPPTGLAVLYRAYDPRRGVRVVLRLIDRPLLAGSATADELILEAPLTIDNFEGVAIVGDSDRMFRVYLLSDDNASKQQRTYLLAFDWRR
ncbi:MAG TPA: esterase-like activity of phytase family protein [Vicinamibacterales bacterium]|nr:esterase-like activity of phytase family protein [Vicinamibacterales bacterium]